MAPRSKKAATPATSEDISKNESKTLLLEMTPDPLPSPPPEVKWWSSSWFRISVVLAALGLWALGAFNFPVQPPSGPTTTSPVTATAPSPPSKPVAGPVTLVEAKRFLIILQRGKNQERRSGGSHPWRQNNPGALAHGAFSKKNGSLGQVNDMAIFPDFETGITALYNFLFETDMKKETISGMAKRMYSARSAVLIKKIVETLDAPATTILNKLSVAQKNKLVETIQDHNEWVPGRVVR